MSTTRKFKVGDRVTCVTSKVMNYDGKCVGLSGTITDIGDRAYPYFIKFDNGASSVFSDKELEYENVVIFNKLIDEYYGLE